MPRPSHEPSRVGTDEEPSVKRVRLDGAEVQEYVPDAIEETGIPMAVEEADEEESAKRPVEDDLGDHEDEV